MLSGTTLFSIPPSCLRLWCHLLDQDSLAGKRYERVLEMPLGHCCVKGLFFQS